MSKFSDKVKVFWMFNFRNPVARKGEHGGFKWVFKRFWLEISTLSGNFKARFTAAEHPYAYLLSGKDDTNIEGFAQTLYTVGMLLTTDQTFVDDIRKALLRYEKRLIREVKEDEGEELAAVKEVQAIQNLVELPKKERKVRERDINGRFKKTAAKIIEDDLRKEN